MTRLLRHFIEDQSGATALDYGLFAALAVVVVVGAIYGL